MKLSYLIASRRTSWVSRVEDRREVRSSPSTNVTTLRESDRSNSETCSNATPESPVGSRLKGASHEQPRTPRSNCSTTHLRLVSEVPFHPLRSFHLSQRLEKLYTLPESQSASLFAERRLPVNVLRFQQHAAGQKIARDESSFVQYWKHSTLYVPKVG